MKKIFTIFIAVFFLGGVVFMAQTRKNQRSVEENTVIEQNNLMKLISSVFEANGMIPETYTCDGKNINPALAWNGEPEGTVSFALIMEDPDVPKSIRPDGMWDHWVLWNIPKETREIQEGETPAGITGRNTSGKNAYQGPCPPDREHRYFFRLYALDTMLDLEPGADKKDLLDAMRGHVLAEAELMGRYERK